MRELFITFLIVLCLYSIIKIQIINNEIIEVSKVISAEACSEGKLGMWLLANTIKNRSIIYNKTPFEIIKKSNQYYGYISPFKSRLYYECGKISDNIANKLYKNNLEDLTNGAIYVKLLTEPKRKWHNTKTIQYMNHEFYK